MFEHYIFGEFIKSSKPLCRQDLDKIFAKADRASGKLQELPMEKIIDLLDSVAHLWLYENYHLRKIALEKMPEIVGYSQEMAAEAIDALFSNMERHSLHRILRGHIGRFAYLDHFEYIPMFDGYIRAQPLGTVLHVSPGNVFVGGVDSLMYGFLSKNVNLLKLSRQDPLFPFLFAQSLKEVDESEFLCNSFAILNYSGKDKDIADLFKERCDGIVVIGGEDAVQSYRRDLPLGTRLIEYGPKYSFSIITADGFKEDEKEDVFERCAYDVALWEQRACSSPQVIYIEKEIAGEFLEKFPDYLERISQKFPQKNLSTDEKIEILKTRELAKFMEAEGSATLLAPARSDRWTIIYEESPAFKFSPLNRVIYIKPFSNWADILGEAMKIKDYLQTVGLQVSEGQIKMLSKALSRIGVSRITKIGEMGNGQPGSPHDFDFPLRRLVKWVTIEGFEKRFDLGDRVAPVKPAVSKWERIRNILRYARDNSSFYKEHLKGIAVRDISDCDSLTQVPLLDKNHIYKNTPPVSEAMLTAHLAKAYVFASGGSTGEPKFNYYSFRELDEVSSILADIYQIAGITKNDVVANLFMAGSLWTSFIVVNHALEKIGCVSMPISGNADMELVLRYVELFRPTAVVGLPSMIIQLAEEIIRRGMNTRIEKILYGGEHFSDEAVRFLREAVGARFVHSAGYASVDAGPIGYQCSEISGGMHHLLYEYMYLEFVDPETGIPVEKGKIGEIVVTNLNRRLMPIIRYKTGDLGRFAEQSCKCLHRTPLFELLGRCDDVLRVGAMSIYPNMIAEALAKVEGLSPIFQITADYDGVKEKVIVMCELIEGGCDCSVVSQKAKDILLKHDPELDLVVKEGWLGELDVKVLNPGEIMRNPRTGKIQRVIDKRKRGK